MLNDDTIEMMKRNCIDFARDNGIKKWANQVTEVINK